MIARQRVGWSAVSVRPRASPHPALWGIFSRWEKRLAAGTCVGAAGVGNCAGDEVDAPNARPRLTEEKRHSWRADLVQVQHVQGDAQRCHRRRRSATTNRDIDRLWSCAQASGRPLQARNVGPAQGAGPTDWTPPSDGPFRSVTEGGESLPGTGSERAGPLSTRHVTLRCRCMSCAAMKFEKR